MRSFKFLIYDEEMIVCSLYSLFRYLRPRNDICRSPKHRRVVQPVLQLIHVTWLYVVEGNRMIAAALLSLQTEGNTITTAGH